MEKITALIVDDAKFMRVTLKKILDSYDVEVVGEAENGLRAIEQYIVHKPSLVLMDIAMPILDGIESIKRIMKINPDAHILVCSTLSERQKVIDAIKEGAATYILKPPSEEKLINEINNIFSEQTLVKKKKVTNVEFQEYNAIPDNDTDYEIGYRAALIDVGRRLLGDNIDISKVCFYLNMDERILKEENLISNNEEVIDG